MKFSPRKVTSSFQMEVTLTLGELIRNHGWLTDRNVPMDRVKASVIIPGGGDYSGMELDETTTIKLRWEQNETHHEDSKCDVDDNGWCHIHNCYMSNCP